MSWWSLDQCEGIEKWVCVVGGGLLEDRGLVCGLRLDVLRIAESKLNCYES